MPLFPAALLANLPQLLISYIYVAFNNLLTCMVAGHKWLQYATIKKPLRATTPKGKQKGTYYLQLPYRYSLPLLIVSGLLSWLASQSLFVVRVAVQNPGMWFMSDTLLSTCAYSPLAILAFLLVGFVYMTTVAALGLRTYPTGMPLSATCSAAISAACHPPDDEIDTALLPVQWGVVSTKDGVGHCSFSSRLVAPPIPGQRYE